MWSRQRFSSRRGGVALLRACVCKLQGINLFALKLRCVSVGLAYVESELLFALRCYGAAKRAISGYLSTGELTYSYDTYYVPLKCTQQYFKCFRFC